MRSRVMPGSSPTMERREPVRRLKRVDLPTLGRPQMAMRGGMAGGWWGPAGGARETLFVGCRGWRGAGGRRERHLFGELLGAVPGEDVGGGGVGFGTADVGGVGGATA